MNVLVSCQNFRDPNFEFPDSRIFGFAFLTRAPVSSAYRYSVDVTLVAGESLFTHAITNVPQL